MRTDSVRTGFERRLLEALTEIDARRPAATRASARQPRRRWMRRPVVLAGAVTAVVLAGGAAAGSKLIFEPKEVLGTKETLRAGESTGIKGWGCQPGSVVTIRLDGADLGTTTAEVQTEPVVGWFVIHVTIPTTTPPGEHALTSTCPAPEGGEKVLTRKITVLAP